MIRLIVGGALLGLLLAHAGPHATGVVVLGGAAVAAWALLGGRGSRTATGHAHGHGRALLRHEGGHIHAAGQIGARVTSATVSNGSGLVELHRADVARMTSQQYIAFMRTGRYAGGSTVGCSGDDRNIREEKARMRAAGATPAEVRAVERAADSDARRYARSGRVDHWADKLGERGRL